MNAHNVSGYITAEVAARKTQYSYHHFTRKLKKGEIPGAIKVGYQWFVPEGISKEDIHNSPLDTPEKVKDG